MLAIERRSVFEDDRKATAHHGFRNVDAVQSAGSNGAPIDVLVTRKAPQQAAVDHAAQGACSIRPAAPVGDPDPAGLLIFRGIYPKKSDLCRPDLQGIPVDGPGDVGDVLCLGGSRPERQGGKKDETVH
jgi:hypothetical protein